MTEKKIRAILDLVASGVLSSDCALDRLKYLPFEDLGFARLDHHRSLRRGLPEVIFGEGKSADQIAEVAKRMVAAGVNLLVTRLAPDKARLLKRRLRALDYRPDAQIGMIIREQPELRTH